MSKIYKGTTNLTSSKSIKDTPERRKRQAIRKELPLLDAVLDDPRRNCKGEALFKSDMCKDCLVKKPCREYLARTARINYVGR